MRKPPPRTKKPSAPTGAADDAAEHALVAPSGAASKVTLTPAQRRVFAEALRRAEDTRNVMEDTLVSFGRWVLVHVFEDDAAAALEHRADNPVWMSLLARAGGPTLQLSPRLLYVALHIAARDKRITDQAWRMLEPGRKELLLPLGDEALMREAAQHVQAMKLSQRATRAYVDGLRSEHGRARRSRLTGRGLASRVKRLGATVATASFARQAARAAAELSDAERAEVRRDVEALRAWSSELLRVLRRAR